VEATTEAKERAEEKADAEKLKKATCRPKKRTKRERRKNREQFSASGFGEQYRTGLIERMLR
jgi:hypothetical protein